MIRSTRKTPITGVMTARSGKRDKRFANRRQRRIVRGRLSKSWEEL
jgi:hypothetical protein